MSDTPIDTAPSCQDPIDRQSVSPAQALEIIDRTVKPIAETEELTVRGALGRVLAEGVISPMDVPPHRNSAMDGYAVRGSDLPASGTVQLKVIGTALAGVAFHGRVGDGQCVRIMTGAPMPEGADTVVMQEHCEAGTDCVRIDDRHKHGQNVREAGEDIAAGTEILPAGRRIGPPELGLLASLGLADVAVWRRPKVALFSTGDELRSIGQPLGEGQIYDSNRYTLYGMLTEMGLEVIDMGVVPDRPDSISKAIGTAAAQADAIITSGGVSVGQADFIKEVLLKLGGIAFWKIAMKPGRPLAFGQVCGTLFFGLPGNPVSAMVTFYQFVRPGLKRLSGETARLVPRFTVPCTSALHKSPGRTEYQRGVLAPDETGQLVVTSTGHQGSGLLTSMSMANCFIILPQDAAPVAPGDLVQVQPFDLLRF